MKNLSGVIKNLDLSLVVDRENLPEKYHVFQNVWRCVLSCARTKQTGSFYYSFSPKDINAQDLVTIMVQDFYIIRNYSLTQWEKECYFDIYIDIEKWRKTEKEMRAMKVKARKELEKIVGWNGYLQLVRAEDDLS